MGVQEKARAPEDAIKLPTNANGEIATKGIYLVIGGPAVCLALAGISGWLGFEVLQSAFALGVLVTALVGMVIFGYGAATDPNLVIRKDGKLV